MTPKPRRFADLRQPVISPATCHDEPIDRVVMRLFTSSADGFRVLGWMIAESQAVTPRHAPECALREAEGARRFIGEIHQMAQGSYVAPSN